MELPLDTETKLTELRDSDKADLVHWLNDKDIYKRTLRIPFPYTENDAGNFLKYARDKESKFSRQMEWAIRNGSGKLIGVIGLHGKEENKFRDEIGYWLAKDYWGKGIMKKALRAVTNIATETYGLVRIDAPIFAFNLHSQKVAEKCGYALEGTLRSFYYKDGMFFDCKLFAFVKQ